MSQLGHHVVYRVHDDHKGETIVGTEMVDQVDPATGQTRQVEQPKVVRAGSIHHREMEEFAGLVGRVHDDGSCDIVIFPPNRPPVWVDKVGPGSGAHQFRLVEPDDKTSPEPAA